MTHTNSQPRLMTKLSSKWSRQAHAWTKIRTKFDYVHEPWPWHRTDSSRGMQSWYVPKQPAFERRTHLSTVRVTSSSIPSIAKVLVGVVSIPSSQIVQTGVFLCHDSTRLFRGLRDEGWCGSEHQQSRSDNVLHVYLKCEYRWPNLELWESVDALILIPPSVFLFSFVFSWRATCINDYARAIFQQLLCFEVTHGKNWLTWRALRKYAHCKFAYRTEIHNFSVQF